MKGFWRHIAASASITAVFLISAAALTVSAVPVTPSTVEAAPSAVKASLAGSLVELARAVDEAIQALPAQPDPATAEPRTSAASTTAASKKQAPAGDEPAGGQASADPQQQAPGTQPGAPVTSGINPDLPAPSNLRADYDYNPGNPRVNLNWDAVSAPGFRDYEVERWDTGDLAAMVEIYFALAGIDASALPYAEDFKYQVGQSQSQGLTQTEREDILASMRKDTDALNAVLAVNPKAADLWEKLLSLADRYVTRKNDLKNNRVSMDRYYLYVVVARYNGGATSAPSACEALYSYVNSYTPPAQPTGFTAIAYDPGVALEWSRGSETNLAGYNVYLVQDGTPVQLNKELITRGTAFFHDIGAAGGTYQVVAVSIMGVSGHAASAVSVLAPAQVFDADSPAWLFPAGTWGREDYSAIESGGRVLRVSMGAGNRASLTFTGRRVRVYSARYWSCGSVRYYIDGAPRGSFNLYYNGGYSDPLNPFVPALWQQMTFQVTGLSKGKHTLVIEVVGSGGEEGLNFVNFDYAEVR